MIQNKKFIKGDCSEKLIRVTKEHWILQKKFKEIKKAYQPKEFTNFNHDIYRAYQESLFEYKLCLYECRAFHHPWRWSWLIESEENELIEAENLLLRYMRRNWKDDWKNDTDVKNFALHELQWKYQYENFQKTVWSLEKVNLWVDNSNLELRYELDEIVPKQFWWIFEEQDLPIMEKISSFNYDKLLDLILIII